MQQALEDAQGAHQANPGQALCSQGGGQAEDRLCSSGAPRYCSDAASLHSPGRAMPDLGHALCREAASHLHPAGPTANLGLEGTSAVSAWCFPATTPESGRAKNLQQHCKSAGSLTSRARLAACLPHRLTLLVQQGLQQHRQRKGVPQTSHQLQFQAGHTCSPGKAQVHSGQERPSLDSGHVCDPQPQQSLGCQRRPPAYWQCSTRLLQSACLPGCH